MNKPQKGSLAIISALRCGQSTVIAEVLRRRRISTFRSPLPPGTPGGEVNGVNYFLWTCPNLSA